MTTADEDRIALRQAESLRLRIRGYSFREIARDQGCSLAVAHSDVRTALGEAKKLTEDELQAERDLELHRIDAALRVVAKILNEREISAAEAAKLEISPSELLDSEDELKLKAIDRQVKLQEQRAKLLGLYAPVKQELAGSIEVSEATPAKAREIMGELFESKAAPDKQAAAEITGEDLKET